MNISPKATALVLARAAAIGVTAEAIEKCKPPTYKHMPGAGQQIKPQKVAIINGIRMSLNQAKQYISACERRVANGLHPLKSKSK